jgi:hypothetical protein
MDWKQQPDMCLFCSYLSLKPTFYNKHDSGHKKMSFEILAAETQDLFRQKEINVKSIGVQNGNERVSLVSQEYRLPRKILSQVNFITKLEIYDHVNLYGQFREAYEQRRHDHIPVIKEWRLNLARLSHIHNLFLVAYTDKIFVYEPIYPSQRLPDKPSLILSPPRTSLATAGYIDRESPHSINHLFLDFLGCMEVVLVACDDGDVICYYTRDIQAAIERRKGEDGPSSTFGDETRQLFVHNVRSSAWGLSVHTNSRKVAISANDHKVTVVAFGLTQDPFPHHGDMTDANKRTSDHSFVIGGFQNNIPAVAFCNTEDDPEGRLVVSGDLTGFVYIHDLETLSRTDMMQVGFCCKPGTADPRCKCIDRSSYPHSIWGLSFIDKRVFRKLSGYAPDQILDSKFDKHWNGSFMRMCVPDSSCKCL